MCFDPCRQSGFYRGMTIKRAIKRNLRGFHDGFDLCLVNLVPTLSQNLVCG